MSTKGWICNELNNESAAVLSGPAGLWPCSIKSWFQTSSLTWAWPCCSCTILSHPAQSPCPLEQCKGMGRCPSVSFHSSLAGKGLGWEFLSPQSPQCHWLFLPSHGCTPVFMCTVNDALEKWDWWKTKPHSWVSVRGSTPGWVLKVELRKSMFLKFHPNGKSQKKFSLEMIQGGSVSFIAKAPRGWWIMQRNSHFLILMLGSFQPFSPHLNNNLSEFGVPEVKTWGELSVKSISVQGDSKRLENIAKEFPFSDPDVRIFPTI